PPQENRNAPFGSEFVTAKPPASGSPICGLAVVQRTKHNLESLFRIRANGAQSPRPCLPHFGIAVAFSQITQDWGCQFVETGRGRLRFPRHGAIEEPPRRRSPRSPWLAPLRHPPADKTWCIFPYKGVGLPA